MSKIFKILFILGAFSAMSCQAASDGVYTGIQAGVTAAGTSGSVGDGFYGHVLLGEQFNRFFALEVGGTAMPHNTLNKDDWIDRAYFNHIIMAAYTVDADAKVMLPINDKVNLYLKAGPSMAHTKLSADNSDDTYQRNILVANASTGVSVDLTKHVSTDLSVGGMKGDDFVSVFAALGFSYHFV